MLLCQRNVALLYYYFDYDQKSSLCVDTSVQMLCTQFNLMYTDGGKGHIVAESCPFCPANVDIKCFVQFPFPNYIFIRPRYRFDHCIVLPAFSHCQQGYILQTKLNFAQDLSNLLHGFFKVVMASSPGEVNFLKWLNRFFTRPILPDLTKISPSSLRYEECLCDVKEFKSLEKRLLDFSNC